MAKSIIKNVRISGISFTVPKGYKVNVDELSLLFDNDEKKLARAKKIIGYGDRYYSPLGVTSVDLCEVAANDLIEKMGIDKSTIDGLVFVSQTPDYRTPASACVLHDRLKLSVNCAAMDINQGCTGYVYGLWTASSLVASGACKKVLLLAGENFPIEESVYRKIKKQSNLKHINKSSYLIFSSGACATLLEYDEHAKEMKFITGSDGSGFEHIIAPAGGARLDLKASFINKTIKDKDGQDWTLRGFMDGLAVFDFTISVVPPHIKELLEFSGDTFDSIDFFAIHQANKQIVKTVAMSAEIPNDKYDTNTFIEYGNMAGVSCISNLVHNLGETLNNEEKRVALVSYGIGLSWASVVMDIGNIYCSGIKLHRFKNVISQRKVLKYWINKLENYSGGNQ